MSKKKIAAFAAAAVMTFGMANSGATAVLPLFSGTAVTASAYDKNTEGFVTRMYDVVLGRKPDSQGLKNWTSRLNNQTATAADIINGFFQSDEYKGKKKSADEMITDCYKAMLDRSPDSAGKATWKRRFDIGMTVQAVCKGFVGSSEFSGLCKTYGIKTGTITPTNARDENYERTHFVYRLYKNCLGREPDIKGLENWCRNIKNGQTGSKTAQGFVFSSEYMNKQNEKTGAEFVEGYIGMLYRTILGREPDSAGMKNWSEMMISGKSLEHIFNGFLQSNEFKGQCSKAGISVGDAIATPDKIPLETYPGKIVALINKERAAKGAPEIKLDAGVSKAAYEFVEEIAAGKDTSNFCVSAHLSDAGVSGYGKFEYSCPNTIYSYFSEYMSGSKYIRVTPSSVLTKNVQEIMLDPELRRVGIAYHNYDNKEVKWVLFFID